MPCYDPPPPYQDEEKENAEKAVSLLCGEIAHKIDNKEPITRSSLLWFLEHKKIDLKIATNSSSFNIYTKDEINKAKYYINLVEGLLSSD